MKHTCDDKTVEDALDITHALVARKIIAPYGHLKNEADIEDLLQSAKLWTLTTLHGYDPDKGVLYSWVARGFAMWQSKDAARRMQLMAERLYDSSPGACEGEDDPFARYVNSLSAEPQAASELGLRGQEMLAMIPEAARQSVELHLAHGASQSATAEHLGISKRTVQRHVIAARAIWDEAA